MNSINTSCRIGVFYDGNFLLHASNYYNYIHPERRRLSLNGLHRFIRHRVAEEAGCETVKGQISVAHYFRGASMLLKQLCEATNCTTTAYSTTS